MKSRLPSNVYGELDETIWGYSLIARFSVRGLFRGQGQFEGKGASRLNQHPAEGKSIFLELGSILHQTIARLNTGKVYYRQHLKKS